MRVLHINQSDILGGAAIAAYRLHQGLRTQGIDSRLLVDKVATDSDFVTQLSRKRLVEEITSRAASRLGLKYLNLLSTFFIPREPSYQSAKIINFHSLHSNYFNYLALPKLTHDKCVVLTLHDMWSFTGHCAYSFDCNRWKSGCGKCPYPDSYPPITKDTTHLEWMLKNWVYEHSPLTIVAPSTWLYQTAKSSILSRFHIHHIPNGIDTTIYYPLDPEQCRSSLGIPKHKIVLMFAAANLSEHRKGGDLLYHSLTKLPDSLKDEIVLLTLGEGNGFLKDLGIQQLSLGYTSGDRFKSIAYSAADMFLFPTRADNLPLTLQESMACGTPMVSFKIGGVPDLVQPGTTGYLAEPENYDDFADGIVELVEDSQMRECMNQHCREIACSEYSLALQAKRYISLYRQLEEDQTKEI